MFIRKKFGVRSFERRRALCTMFDGKSVIKLNIRVATSTDKLWLQDAVLPTELGNEKSEKFYENS